MEIGEKRRKKRRPGGDTGQSCQKDVTRINTHKRHYYDDDDMNMDNNDTWSL